jgi:hypothetical protein
VAVQSVLDFLGTFTQRFRHERKYNTVTSELGMEKGTKEGGTKGYRRMGFLLCAFVPLSRSP